MRTTGLALLAVLAAGCSTSAQDLPLPGSRVSGSTYRVGAVFDDALNLAEGAPVKVDGVTVGRVRDVAGGQTSPPASTSTCGRRPSCTTEPRPDCARRPRSESCSCRSTTSPPGRGCATERSSEHDRTSAAPTIEDTMTSASLVINGGGLGQLQTIVRESNLVLGGREDDRPRRPRPHGAHGEGPERLERRHRHRARRVGRRLRPPWTSSAPPRTPRCATSHRRRECCARTPTSSSPCCAASTGSERSPRTSSTRPGTTCSAPCKAMGPVFDELNALEDELGPGIDTLVHFAGLVDRGCRRTT